LKGFLNFNIPPKGSLKMPPRIFITTAVLKLLIAIAHLIAWWLLMMAMAWGFRQLPAEQYAQGDAISPMFTVLVRTPQGEVLPQRLHNLKSNETLLRQAFSRDDENGRFFSLTPVAPDAFELFVNYDTAQLTQRYRITADNQVVPLSFKSWSVGHGFILFLLSFPLFALLKWLLRRWLFRLPLRHSNAAPSH
jgi:hypothetical protein